MRDVTRASIFRPSFVSCFCVKKWASLIRFILQSVPFISLFCAVIKKNYKIWWILHSASAIINQVIIAGFVLYAISVYLHWLLQYSTSNNSIVEYLSDQWSCLAKLFAMVCRLLQRAVLQTHDWLCFWSRVMVQWGTLHTRECPLGFRSTTLRAVDEFL